MSVLCSRSVNSDIPGMTVSEFGHSGRHTELHALVTQSACQLGGGIPDRPYPTRWVGIPGDASMPAWVGNVLTVNRQRATSGQTASALGGSLSLPKLRTLTLGPVC